MQIESPLELRQILEPMLADELGLFSNGVTSLWVTPPLLTSGLNCDGLQVMIDRYSKPIQPAKSKLNNQATELIDWVVTLTQFDTSNEGMVKLDSAAQKIHDRFPNHRRRVLPLLEDVYPVIEFRLAFSRVFNCTT